MSRATSVSYLPTRAPVPETRPSVAAPPPIVSPELRLWLEHPYLKGVWPTDGLVLYRLPFVVGRMPDDERTPRNQVDLLLPDRPPYQLSAVHFCLLNYDGRLAVMDTNSQLGTYVNGVALGRGCSRNHALLSRGENRITIGTGNTRFVFTLQLT
jgi:FHA domain